MADVDVTLRLGMFSAVATWRESVPEALIEQFQELAAEFEILEMALHDDHYGAGQFGGLLGAGLTLPAPFQADDGRTASSDVVGNIGEGLGMATLCTVFGFAQDEVARIRRQRQRQHSVARRTPDFSICGRPGLSVSQRLDALTARIRNRRRAQEYTQAVATFPDRFPVESKASFGTTGAQWSAVWQLIEYWHQVLVYAPGASDAGYGMLLETNGIGTPARSVRITVLAPNDLTEFQSRMGSLVNDRGNKRAFLAQFNQTRGPFAGH